MRRYLLIIGLLCFGSMAMAQGTISGKISDGIHTVPFVHVGLSEMPQFTTATDADGNFEMKDVPFGTYQLVVSAVGYRKIEQTVVVSEPKTDLGTLILQEDAIGLEEVVVTGTLQETGILASPVKVEVLPMRTILKSISPTNVMESISLINGVQEVVACGVCYTNNISINGLPGAYTAILMDGTPIFGNLASVYGLNGIPTQIIERFEVIRGPVSTLYGSEAVAGVINIITKDPKKQPFLSVDWMGTSHLESYTNIAIAPQIGKLNGYVGLHHAYIDNFEDRNDDGFGDVASMDRFSLFTKWSLDRRSSKNFTFGGKFYYEDRRNGLEDFVKNRAYRDLRGSEIVYGESIYAHRAEFFGTYEFATTLPLKLDYSLSTHRQDSYYGSDYYEAQQDIAFANLIAPLTTGRHQILAGATFRYQKYNDNTMATPTADTQWIYGVFLQDEWEVIPSFTLLGGARLDYYQAHEPIFAPRVSAKYQLNEWSALRANFGTGFRIVNLFTEDHAFVTGQREVEIVEELSPESSYNFSINYNQVYTIGNSQGMLDIDAFYTYFTNKITPDYDTPGKIIYANSPGHALTRGIGFSLSHQFTMPLSFNLGFNWQRATQEVENETGALESQPIEFAPDWTSVFTANYRFRKPQIDVAFTLQLTGPMQLPEVFDLNEEGEPLAESRPTRSQPFTFGSVQLTKQINKALSLYGGIQNLFDYQQPFSPLTGFNDPNALPGFSNQFDTAYGYAIGHSREFYVGIRWNLER